MPGETTRRQVATALRRLSDAELDTSSYRHEAVALLRRAVGFDAWCWALVDPASGLPSPAVADNPVIGNRQVRFSQLTYAVPDAPVQADAWTGDSAVSMLSDSTGGDLRRSVRWRELLGPGGIGDQLEARLVADRLCWGGPPVVVP